MAIVGVGTDVADVARFARLLERDSTRFLDRWFTATEVDWLLSQRRLAQHTAAQFAGKEAVLKSIRVPDVGPVRWREIEITRTGLPHQVVVHGSVRELAAEAGVSDFQLAIWHNERVATATAVAVTQGRPQAALPSGECSP